MKLKRFAMLLAMILAAQCALLAGCGGDQGADAKGATRTITDMDGRSVEIAAEIQRVACQSSTCEAAVISLGKAELLVGTTDYTDEDSFAFKLFPALSDVTKLADDLSVEEMLKENVQVVFVKDTNKIEKYEEAGLPVVYVDFDTVAGTKEGIRIIGEVIGAEEQARKCVDYINDAEQLVTERFENAGQESFSAYYSRAKYAESSLLTTYAAGHIYSEWIGICGGTVITRDMELAETKGGVTINGEELISANPDFIFVGGYYRSDVYRDAMDGAYSQVLDAVKNRNVCVVPTSVTDWSVGSCELGLTTLWCARQVAPELFGDIDMTAELIGFYKEIAGIDVSESLANAILNSEG